MMMFDNNIKMLAHMTYIHFTNQTTDFNNISKIENICH